MFEYIAVETLIHEKQSKYYKTLEQCDLDGDSTSFEFSRQEYLQIHKGLSTATASRDLAQAVAEKTLVKIGERALTTYKRSYGSPSNI